MQGLKQVHIDSAKLAMHTRGAVTYQIATALQSALSLLLDPEHTLACVLLLCIFTECASRVQGVDVSIARQVLQSQLGLSFMSAIDHVLRNSATSTMAIFLVRTYGLCIPSVLGAVSPSMLANDYVQTAIMSYVKLIESGLFERMASAISPAPSRRSALTSAPQLRSTVASSRLPAAKAANSGVSP